MTQKSTPSRRRHQPRLTATVGDVAKAAGVSTASVSRALKRPLMVSEATRARVLEAANLLSYSGGISQRAAEARAPHAVGAIFGRPVDGDRSAQLIGELDAELDSAGFVLCVAWASADALVRAEGLVAAGVAVLITQHISMAEAQWISRRLSVPCVVFNEPEMEFADRARSSFLAVEYLRWLGHRDIVLVGSPEGDLVANADALTRDVAPVGYLSLQGASVLIERMAAASRSRATMECPTALICDTDATASLLVDRCQEAGLSVPRDISIMGAGDTFACRATDPPLTSIRWGAMSGAELARLAVACVLEGRQGVARAVKPKVVVRRSTTSI